MFNILFRRLQKYTLPLKILVLATTLPAAGYIILNLSPDTTSIVFVALLIVFILLTSLSFFLSLRVSFLISISIPFLLFLRAVDLLSPANLGLFLAFITLLALYLWKK